MNYSCIAKLRMGEVAAGSCFGYVARRLREGLADAWPISIGKHSRQVGAHYQAHLVLCCIGFPANATIHVEHYAVSCEGERLVVVRDEYCLG